MNLIPVNYDNDRQTVSAKALYDFLELDKSQWSRWHKKNIEEDDCFTEGIDYVPLDMMSNGNPTKDFQLTIEMAKELSMMARTERGKQARQYFIELEKRWNSPEAVMARALKMADKKLLEYQTKVTELLPKAEYFDALVDRNLLTNFRDTAKELHIGQNEFIDWLLEKKYIYRDPKGKLLPCSPYTPSLFELKESMNGNWKGLQTLINPKGRETFRLLLNKEGVKA